MTRIYSEEAELYDIAFDWDLSEEADWLVQRLGRTCLSVPEPGCGTGRLLEAFAQRGLAVAGIASTARSPRSAPWGSSLPSGSRGISTPWPGTWSRAAATSFSRQSPANPASLALGVGAERDGVKLHVV